MLAVDVVGRVDGVHDGQSESSTGLEHAGDLADRGAHVVDVHQRHERDGEIGMSVGKRQLGGIRNDVLTARVRLPSGRDHRLGRVEPDGTVPELLQVARYTSFTAADVERQAAGSGHEVEETFAMKTPVAVVSGLQRPAHPVGRVSLPGIPEVHHGSVTFGARGTLRPWRL
jgi:hypothetical protein